MTTQFITEKTAFMYALHESDRNVYDKRQKLLASLNLSPDEEAFYQMLFNWYKMHSETCTAKIINIKSFWIYAYAKQSERFYSQLEKHYFHHHFRSPLYEEKCLKKYFLASYPVIERGYPHMFILAQESGIMEIAKNENLSA